MEEWNDTRSERWADLCAKSERLDLPNRRLLDQFAIQPSVNAGINGRLWTFSDGSTLCHDGGKFLVMRPKCQTNR